MLLPARGSDPFPPGSGFCPFPALIEAGRQRARPLHPSPFGFLQSAGFLGRYLQGQIWKIPDTALKELERKGGRKEEGRGAMKSRGEDGSVETL